MLHTNHAPTAFRRIRKNTNNEPTLSNHAADQSQLAQIFHCHVRDIGPCFVQIGPSQKAPCPIPLSGFVAIDELIIVDGPVRSIQSVRAFSATIISQTRASRYSGSCKQHGLCMSTTTGGKMGTRRNWRRKKSSQGTLSSYGGIGRIRYDDRRRQRPCVCIQISESVWWFER